jgi:hypothetical protein
MPRSRVYRGTGASGGSGGPVSPSSPLTPWRVAAGRFYFFAPEACDYAPVPEASAIFYGCFTGRHDAISVMLMPVLNSRPCSHQSSVTLCSDHTGQHRRLPLKSHCFDLASEHGYQTRQQALSMRFAAICNRDPYKPNFFFKSSISLIWFLFRASVMRCP